MALEQILGIYKLLAPHRLLLIDKPKGTEGSEGKVRVTSGLQVLHSTSAVSSPVNFKQILLSSLRHNTHLAAIFHDNHSGFIGAKDCGSGGDICSYKTCKVPVKVSPPLSQHPIFTGRMPFLSPNCRHSIFGWETSTGKINSTNEPQQNTNTHQHGQQVLQTQNTNTHQHREQVLQTHQTVTCQSCQTHRCINENKTESSES